ncbi:MAG: metallophosphoesterase [Muribaculaceae bacterium]
MRVPMLAMIILLIVNIAADAYIYIRIRRAFKTKYPSVAYLVLTILLFAYIMVALALPRRSIDNEGLRVIMFMFYSYLTFYVPKIIYIICDLISFIPRLWRCRKIPYLSSVGIVLGLFMFISMWWGSLVTVNDCEVVEETIEYNNLPKDFDGYKIVQFSDFHVGTYGTDTTFVAKAVNIINELRPNVIVFTGDLVNRETSELLPFMKPLSRLKAPDGVYSILGNHDYGDYMNWDTPMAKEKNMQQLVDAQKLMGWILLNNNHRMIKHGHDSIAMIGVENWGEPPFKKHGDLKKAYPTLNDSLFKIMLSHNPNHWRGEILPKTNIDLTLSGHTHAMQVLMNIAGYKFSPAVFRYDEWAGIYDENSKKLYVNIGLGQVAFPMRVGATPEITLITLKRKK